MQGCSNCEAFIKDSFNTFYNLESLLVYKLHVLSFHNEHCAQSGKLLPILCFYIVFAPQHPAPSPSFPPFLVLFELPSALFRNFSFVPINPTLF